MSLPIDYNSLLSSDYPGVPYDVTFLIFNQEKEQQGEVQGHKFVFALNSPVFKSRFCGAGNFAGNNDKDVEITGTLEAFRLLTDFIYNKPTAIDELSVDKLFDVVDLAHCYDIAKLEEALEKRLGEDIIAKDEVIGAAKKAEEFAMFETASHALLENCAKTLQESLTDAKAVFEFSSQVAGTGDEAVCLKLFAMMKDLQPLQHLPPLQPLGCSNCKTSPSCISGSAVTSITQMRVGTRLAPNARYWGKNSGYGRTEVVFVDASGGTVYIKAGEGAIKFNPSWAYPVNTSSPGMFCFA